MLLEYEHIDSGFIIIRLTIQSTPLNRFTSGQAILTRLIEKFDPIKTPILTKITKFKLKLPNI